MEALFIQLCNELATNPWLQGLLIVAGTCFLEDPARCAVALLAAGDKVDPKFAFICMVIGALVGDIGLYLIGRFASQVLYRKKRIDRAKLAWMKLTFRRHAILPIILSRYIPGARMLTFTAAGITRFSPLRFLLLILIAAVSQAFIFLQLGEWIGQMILPYLTSTWLKTVVFLFTLATFYVAYLAFAKKTKKKLPSAPADGEQPSSL